MEVTTGAVTASDGIELFTRTWVPESPKASVLIVHGAGEHSGRWDHVGRFLADRGYAVIAFDLRGHGKSRGRRFHVDSFDQFLGDIVDVTDTLDDKLPWALYGHSLGGLIATMYLESDQPQPGVAVLSAPALDDNLPRYLHLAGEVLGRVVPTLAIDNSFTAEQLSRDPAVGEAYFADPLVQTKATTGFGRAGFAAQRSARDHIDRIRVPTFVIHGAEDPLVPPSASAPLAGVDGVERKLYPGLRHEVHNEPEQDQVLSDIAEWLDVTIGRPE